MPKTVRTHIGGDAPTERSLTPKHLTKQQFGKRLYRLMVDKGWTQSELARRADLPRDAISVYVRGKSLPTPQSLTKLAAALSVSEVQLLPNHAESAIDEDNPSFEMKASPNSPNVVWLRVNRLVTMQTAVQIAGLLNADKAAEAI